MSFRRVRLHANQWWRREPAASKCRMLQPVPYCLVEKIFEVEHESCKSLFEIAATLNDIRHGIDPYQNLATVSINVQFSNF